MRISPLCQPLKAISKRDLFMRVKEIARNISLSRFRSDMGILDYYRENFPGIHKAIHGFTGLKTRIDFDVQKDSLDLIRFASFSNDLTRMSLSSAGEMNLIVMAPNRPTSEFLGIDQLAITISDERQGELPIVDGKLLATPTLSMASDSFSTQMIETVSPLMDSGHLIVEPERGIMILAEDSETPGGPRKFKIFDIDPNSPFDNWSVVDSLEPDPTIPLLRSPGLQAGELKLFNISYPFLAGVPFDALAKILDDEKHYVVQARNALKETVERAGDSDIATVINDVLRPKLDSLERRFKTVSNINSIRQTGATLGAVAISLVAYLTKTMPDVLGAAASAGGLGLVVKQHSDMIEKRDALKEDPYYLLWRLTKMEKEIS